MSNLENDRPLEQTEPPEGVGPAASEPPESEAHGYPTSHLEPAEPLRLDSDRDLSRLGFGTLGLGALILVCGIAFLAAGGILPGALVVGVGLICGVVGLLFLGLVAHHQG